MASTFSFGFSGDDIEHGSDSDEDEMDVDIAGGGGQGPMSSVLVSARLHSLSEMLSTLPSSISYNTLTIPNHSPTIKIQRRSLFDILTQLKAEADIPITEASPEPCNPTTQTVHDTLISSLENTIHPSSSKITNTNPSDLTPGIYEGGLKTWECALDLASYLTSCITEPNPSFNLNLNVDSDLDIVELGAGSAIPSLVLLLHILHMRSTSTPAEKEPQPQPATGIETRTGSIRLFLADYNIDVLRLVTVPNIYLQLRKHMTGEEDGESSAPLRESKEEEEEEDNDDDDAINGEGDASIPPPTTLTSIPTLLSTPPLNLSISLIEGAWSPDLVDIITPFPAPSPASPSPSPPRPLLILTSETIYSLATPPSLVSTILSLLRRSIPGQALALVAAKKMYFGVGGGVDGFADEVRREGGGIRVVWDGVDIGVGRVILEVTLAGGRE